MTGPWAGAGCGGRGLVAGLREGLACGVLLLPGFGVSSSSPQVPVHPTSICDAGVNSDASSSWLTFSHLHHNKFRQFCEFSLKSPCIKIQLHCNANKTSYLSEGVLNSLLCQHFIFCNIQSNLSNTDTKGTEQSVCIPGFHVT